MGLLNIAEMWWLIGSAPDFWGKCPGFESSISHSVPDELQDHCVIKKILDKRIFESENSAMHAPGLHAAKFSNFWNQTHKNIPDHQHSPLFKNKNSTSLHPNDHLCLNLLCSRVGNLLLSSYLRATVRGFTLYIKRVTLSKFLLSLFTKVQP